MNVDNNNKIDQIDFLQFVAANLFILIENLEKNPQIKIQFFT